MQKVIHVDSMMKCMYFSVEVFMNQFIEGAIKF